MGEHAKLSPSSGDRWTTCTASVEAEAKYPDTTNEHAERGTEAHELLERSIKANTHPRELDPKHHSIDGVSMAFDHVAPYLANDRHIVMTEVRVRLSEDCWGTADIVILSDYGEMAVVDYKNGFGLVECDCIQLLIYAAAAYDDLNWLAPGNIDRITTCIIQPNGIHEDGPIRQITRKVEDIAKECFDKVNTAIEAINTGQTEYVPSEKACQWCKHKADCKAFAQDALSKMGAYFEDTGVLSVPLPADIPGLTAENKASILEARGLFKMFLAAIEADVENTLRSGGTVPGFKLVAGRSTRKWTFENDEEAIEFMKKNLKLKLSEITTQKLKGPAQIEKLIDPKKRGGKKKQELLKERIEKPEGKPTLVPESDKRPAIAGFFQDETKNQELF